MTTPNLIARISLLQRNSFYWAIADTLVLAKRGLRHIPRVPEQLIFATINPVIFVLLFRYVFGGAIDTPGMSYSDFLMAGIFVQTVAFGAVNSGVGLAEDMQKGLIDRFRSLPMSPIAVLSGRILADMVRNSLIIAVGILVGLAVGFRPTAGLAGWIGAIALLFMVSLTVSWVSSTIGVMVKGAEATQSANYLWLLPLTFASSAFVPTESMPGPLRAFADVQPITVIVDTVRAFLFDEKLGATGLAAFAWCIVIIAVCAPIAIQRFNATATR